jgi:D-alanyl-lipoteichoic acid acyltransferase DltB (MBOAT superfamily)
MGFVELLKDVFTYKQSAPLIFTQFYFWVFFAFVLSAFGLLIKQKQRLMRTGFLFLVSLFFYYKSSGMFFLLILFTTLIDFNIGRWMSQTEQQNKRRALLALSLIINLSLLVYFKYAYFITQSINETFHTNFEVINYISLIFNSVVGTHFQIDKILLPVGISFYTFQTISYSIDVYRKELKAVNNLIDFGFYVTFFPQLVAGPIVRASQFIPQMYQEYKLTQYQFGMAIFMIMKGLMKKIYIGDYIAVNFIDRIFTNPTHYSGFENLAALFGYSLQVYVDFSGYTDIAIGIAILLGFTLPQNFDSPYKAQNVANFWKRWHISLSTWLKDYLYIPMGGNRGGSVFSYLMLSIVLLFVSLLIGYWWVFPILVLFGLFSILLMRRYQGFAKAINTDINLMLTMLIGGLWHGASWQFIIWGGLNGIGLVVYKLWRKISPWEHSTKWIAVVWKIAITFTFITFTRVFFRAESMEIAQDMFHQIGQLLPAWSDLEYLFTDPLNLKFVQQWRLIPAILMAYQWVFVVMMIGFVFHWLPYKLKNRYTDWFIALPFYLKVLVFSLVVFWVYQSISSEMQAFIYFQF